MTGWFLQFRESNYWYLFIWVVIAVVVLILSRVKSKSPSRYKRLVKLTILLPWSFLMVCSLAILVMFIAFGPSEDWVENYTMVLLIVGPILISCLVIYAVKKEERGE